jgi:hypothetical protein
MKRTNFKIAMVAAGWKHQSLAARANLSLRAKQQLTEHTLTQFVTCRKDPTAEQAAALAEVLGKTEHRLFKRCEGGQG